MSPSPQITLQPSVVNLALYSGDGSSIRLVFDNVMGEPVPLVGTVTAQIRTARTDVSPLQSFTVDLSEAGGGIVLLSLTGAQTASLASASDFVGVWDVQYTATGGEPQTLIQGRVNVKQDVTRS